MRQRTLRFKNLFISRYMPRLDFDIAYRFLCVRGRMSHFKPMCWYCDYYAMLAEMMPRVCQDTITKLKYLMILPLMI